MMPDMMGRRDEDEEDEITPSQVTASPKTKERKAKQRKEKVLFMQMLKKTFSRLSSPDRLNTIFVEIIFQRVM